MFHTATICSIVHSDLATVVNDSALGDIDLALVIGLND